MLGAAQGAESGGHLGSLAGVEGHHEVNLHRVRPMTRQQDIFVHVLFLACAQPTPRMRKAKSQARCTRGRTARQEGVIRRQRVARAQQGRSRSAHLAAVVPNLGDAEKAAPELVERAPGFARVGGGDSLSDATNTSENPGGGSEPTPRSKTRGWTILTCPEHQWRSAGYQGRGTTAPCR